MQCFKLQQIKWIKYSGKNILIVKIHINNQNRKFKREKWSAKTNKQWQNIKEENFDLLKHKRI